MSTESGALALSEDDVQRLLTDDSADVRVDVTAKIAGTYSTSNLSKNENMMAEQVFRLLLRDTELKVRATLAQNVKSSANIPRDIVLTMARDVEEVALPILQYSEVLNDEDLLDIIHSTREVSRYLAISNRPQVSGIVSDNLLEAGNDKVAAALIENSGAQISEQGLSRIIENYGKNETMMNAISQRSHLPISVAEKLISVVSSSLSESLKKKYHLGEPLDKEVEKTREGETLNLVRDARSPEDIEKLIDQLRAFDRLTPSLILSALCQGNFAFFETSLAKLSNISVTNARTLISDRGELGFRAIYNKSGLPEAMFPAVKLLLRVVRELDAEGTKSKGARYANRIVERILQYAEGDDSIENISYIIALVRRVAQS